MIAPRLSAECAIGPALGQYRVAPLGARPGGGPAILAPMTTHQLRRQADLDPRVIPALKAFKEQGMSPCPRDLHVCWSTSTESDHEVDYICCDSYEPCDNQDDGTPYCRDEDQAPATPVLATPVLANGHTR